MSWHSVACASVRPQLQNNSKNSLWVCLSGTKPLIQPESECRKSSSPVLPVPFNPVQQSVIGFMQETCQGNYLTLRNVVLKRTKALIQNDKDERFCVWQHIIKIQSLKTVPSWVCSGTKEKDIQNLGKTLSKWSIIRKSNSFLIGFMANSLFASVSAWKAETSRRRKWIIEQLQRNMCHNLNHERVNIQEK